jgi:hypothetical protein
MVGEDINWGKGEIISQSEIIDIKDPTCLELTRIEKLIMHYYLRVIKQDSTQ